MSDEHLTEAPDQGRRRLLTGLAVGGSAVVGGVAGMGTARAMTNGGTRTRVAFDVAQRADTFRSSETIVGNGTPVEDDIDTEGELRAPFLVEGYIYPEGTIPEGPGFVATVEGTIGRWFCKGWLIIDDNRPEPHVLTDQQYFFGAVDPTEPFPTDTLLTTGLEGMSEEGWEVTRAVTGGTGRYLGATGSITQHQVGTNTITIGDFPSPNFHYAGELFLPM